jgi:BirA family transcriptional regulator, biotin operon repressor / biotin---[acetyl-CoA-carboxylase] ligase
MKTKERVLVLLEEFKGNFLSGETIGKKLKLSRSAVWKSINELKKDGFDIQGVSNKGYCLSLESDRLSSEGICAFINSESKNLSIQVENQVTSTNTLVKKAGASGVPEGYVLVANQQTEGRGRYGRSFFSPESTGIYFSILLRPKMEIDEATTITTIAAVSVAEAIQKVTGKIVQIKWVNDLFFQGSKICGILTEGALNMESKGMDYVVVGIGLNVKLPKDGFPKELATIATSIETAGQEESRNRLVAECLNLFFHYYDQLPEKKYVDNYRKRSLILGKEILVMSTDKGIPARAIDIDENCHLLVEYENKEQEWLSSGEVSIRKLT